MGSFRVLCQLNILFKLLNTLFNFGSNWTPQRSSRDLYYHFENEYASLSKGEKIYDAKKTD